MKKHITVFTPTYNRGYTLNLCYNSLKSQTCKDFVWLIIDDGSTDNTKELIENWKNENTVDINYIYKSNGGMHTAHNEAYRNINTEMNVCIDSDDYMPDNAIEKIIDFWEKHKSEEYAGIIALDADYNGKVIGKEFPSNLKETTLSGYYRNGGRGDKKLIYRTEIIKKYPEYPVFGNEKYVSLGYKYQLCDQDYKLLVLNEIVCNVEYRNDGSSKNMIMQYIKNPKGFSFVRKQDMILSKSVIRKFLSCIHYVSSSIIQRNKYFLRESPKRIMTVIAVPFGIALYLYIIKKTKR